MTGNTPPRLATWLLEHLVPSTSGGQALAGDLQEECHRGRSRGWYWRQTLSALVYGSLAVLDRLRVALLFAMLWSAATPLVVFEWYTSRPGSALFLHTVSYPWPWSACAQLGLAFTLMTVFVCTGFFVYLVLHSLFVRHTHWRRLGFAILSAAAVFSAASCISAAAAFVLPSVYQNVHTVTLAGILTAPQALFTDLPSALALFVAIAVAYPAAVHPPVRRTAR